MIAAIETPLSSEPVAESTYVSCWAEHQKLPDWPVVEKLYDDASDQCSWLMDVINPGGRAASRGKTDPRYLWFHFADADEIETDGVVLQYHLDLQGLQVRRGESLPSKMDILQHFHALVTDSLIRCAAEEARETAGQALGGDE